MMKTGSISMFKAILIQVKSMVCHIQMDHIQNCINFRLDLNFHSSFYSPSFIALSLSVGSGYHTCKILSSVLPVMC